MNGWDMFLIDGDLLIRDLIVIGAIGFIVTCALVYVVVDKVSKIFSGEVDE